MTATAKNARGARDRRPVRYGVVGLGWFAQAAILPAFRHARESSRLVALFSDDEEKLQELGERHDVEGRYSYDDLETAVRDGGVDAIYIAVPNHLHRELAVRAAQAGAHVLCEKPMAVTEQECEEMIRAADLAGVRLMIAYRLHFEKANLSAVEFVQQGRIGEPRFFEAVFANRVTDEDNIRLGPFAQGGGTLYDIGIYCINAARAVFRSEPIEAVALSERGEEERFSQCDETTASVLRFPEHRLASFTTSFGAADHDRYTVYGTEGRLTVEPAFSHRGKLGYRLTIGDDTQQREFEDKDQIAPEILHFTECILEGRPPEPDGREGLADVRIIQALLRSAEERRAISIEPVEQRSRPDLEQARRRPPVGKQELVHAEAPSEK